MVVSLSSDRAVWDAVMNNEVVRELRESFYAGWYESFLQLEKRHLHIMPLFNVFFLGLVAWFPYEGSHLISCAEKNMKFIA